MGQMDLWGKKSVNDTIPLQKQVFQAFNTKMWKNSLF